MGDKVKRRKKVESSSMEDEVEERVVLEACGAGARLAWRGWRPSAPRPELVAVALLAIILLLHARALELWGRELLARLARAPIAARRSSELRDWQDSAPSVATYALQGRRPRMEDRFVQLPDLSGKNTDLYAIFDGHGGELAAQFAKDRLVDSLTEKIIKIKDIMEGKISESPPEPEPKNDKSISEENALDRKKSFKKTISTVDDTSKKEITDPELLSKLKVSKTITREVQKSKSNSEIAKAPLSSYIQMGKINYSKLLSDEILAADELLVEKAKRTFDVAGTTALLAILENESLTVANVGDSRGVMCDHRGNAIPLSFDHKPQQTREHKRIREAGGYIAFNGVWRVAGILATSRAMGDYPLKDKKFVIADPDVLTFNLTDHKPLFIILATDGLWDTFSNEEAVNYIKDRLDEPLFGAKSLTMQSYNRGSVDNITVMIINLKDRQYAVSSAKNPNI